MQASWLAQKFSDRVNRPTLAEAEDWNIRLMFIFEWFAFMAYFLTAAFMVPFTPEISSYFNTLIDQGEAAFSAVTSIDLDLSLTANATTPSSGGPSAKNLMAFWVRQSLALRFESTLTWALVHRTTTTASLRRWTR